MASLTCAMLASSYVHNIETKSQYYNNPMLVGFMSSNGAEIGVQMTGESEVKKYEIIFSMKFLKRLKGKIEFEAVMKMNAHVDKIEDVWIESVPSEAHSFEFSSDIYRVLSECSSSSKVCSVNITV